MGCWCSETMERRWLLGEGLGREDGRWEEDVGVVYWWFIDGMLRKGGLFGSLEDENTRGLVACEGTRTRRRRLYRPNTFLEPINT